MADYYNSIITKHYTDDNGNLTQKLIQNENIKVLSNGISLLDEIPYKPYGVYISGYTEVSSGTALTSTQFYVEYDGAGSGKIHFAVSEIGKHLLVTYKAIGKECIIASRIATEYTEDGDIVQSLADYINTYIEVMDANRIHRQVIKYTATSPITMIPYASITGLTWNPAFDNLQIIKDNLQLIEGENYSVDDVGITLYEALNTGESIFIINFRGLLADVPAPSSDGSLLLNGSVAKFKLEQSVQDSLDTLPTIQSKISNIMTYKRAFTPNLGLFMDLIPGGTFELTQAQMDEHLGYMIDHGINNLIVQCWVKWDGSNLSLWNTISNLTYVANKAISLGMTVSCLKIHFYGLNGADFDALTSQQKTTITTQYPTIVENIVSAFDTANIDVNYVVVINECYPLYKTGTSYATWTNNLINAAQAHGYKVGISTAGAKETINLDSTIIANVDAFFTNCYPRMSFKMEKTTYADTKNSWENSYEIKCLKQIKDNYPTKPLIMSETGCNDFWICLTNPGDSSLGFGGTETEGKAPASMLAGLLQLDTSVQSILEEVWWCYEWHFYHDPIKELVLKYTGGIY